MVARQGLTGKAPDAVRELDPAKRIGLMQAPVYCVAEIDVTNPEAYAKEFAPKAQAIIKAAGGRFLAIGGTAASGPKVTALDGEAPKRVVVQV